MTVRELGDQRIRVIAVIGATAAGKTSLGVELARRFDGEIANADSRLFYRGIDIGTAKPTEIERRGVRHHLIDILGPQDTYSLSDFLRSANRTIDDIHGRGKLPIVVGGSGQYVWGLLEGWNVPEIEPNPMLRDELETQLAEEGIESLQRRLWETGADNIDKVEVLNPRRLVRAIERAVATGDAMGGASKSEVPPFDALVIGLKAPRDVLHDRVATRVNRMLEAGWIDEVRRLIDAGVKRESPAMSAIGYRQLIDYIAGRTSYETVREEVLIGNHRLIGAQHNWFKPSDKRICWLDIADSTYIDGAITMVDEWLSEKTGKSTSG